MIFIFISFMLVLSTFIYVGHISGHAKMDDDSGEYNNNS